MSALPKSFSATIPNAPSARRGAAVSSLRSRDRTPSCRAPGPAAGARRPWRPSRAAKRNARVTCAAALRSSARTRSGPLYLGQRLGKEEEPFGPCDRDAVDPELPAAREGADEPLVEPVVAPAHHPAPVGAQPERQHLATGLPARPTEPGEPPLDDPREQCERRQLPGAPHEKRVPDIQHARRVEHAVQPGVQAPGRRVARFTALKP